MEKIISSGAEAIIVQQDDIVVKRRITKNYRIPSIDNTLRKFRTRREAKVMTKLFDVIPVPKIISVDDKKMEIKMDFIPGLKIRDYLTHENYESVCTMIGKQIAEMHSMDIVHGDLTTSNMIKCNIDEKIYFIDFGLAQFSSKLEDKAVDLHLLKQAFESKHFDIFEKAIPIVIKSYSYNFDLYSDVFKRLDAVEKRGRNKKK